MFRNVESHFSQVPRLENQRSIFKRPCTHKTSGNAGRLYPIYCDIVYPGDTVSMTTSKVVRLQTLLTPIMDNVYLDTYWFFVPMRLVWNHWKEFMGENTQSAWIPQVTYQAPTIAAPATTGFTVGTLADHFGLPVGVPWKATDKHAPFVFPFRAYAAVANEFFRDENITDPLNIPVGDSNQTGTNGDSYINDVANGGMPFKVARYHDYWSSMLPSPQKGVAVTFPLLSGQFAPVGTKLDLHGDLSQAPVKWKSDTSHTVRNFDYILHGTSSTSYDGTIDSNSLTATVGTDHVWPTNLWADLTTNVGAVTVNQLRLAFQLQRYYERLAVGGSRYTELIKSMFNVTSPDGRLQRPEYLGGNRIPVQIHEVTNQAQSANDFLGDLGAMSRTADVHYDFQKSFTEHGVLLGLICMRTDRSYAQGFEPFWLRKQTTDWYFPQFANIGEMPTPTACLYADATTMNSDDVFGYQEAWADMRYKPNYITGEMRPGIANTLASWHLSDYYTQQPTLSDSWLREDVTNLDRCLAVTSQVANQFFADFYFDSTWTRCLPMYSVPGLIDHH